MAFDLKPTCRQRSHGPSHCRAPNGFRGYIVDFAFGGSGPDLFQQLSKYQLEEGFIQASKEDVGQRFDFGTDTAEPGVPP
jgi:hypothetical protein